MVFTQEEVVWRRVQRKVTGRLAAAPHVEKGVSGSLPGHTRQAEGRIGLVAETRASGPRC